MELTGLLIHPLGFGLTTTYAAVPQPHIEACDRSAQNKAGMLLSPRLLSTLGLKGHLQLNSYADAEAKKNSRVYPMH